MKIVDGMVVLGERNCFRCQGEKQTMLRKLCPNYGKSTNHRPCPHCGATRKDSHRALELGIGPCPDCMATGTRPETICDYLPAEVWADLTFKVYRSDRGLTFNERMLGGGCVYSVEDYGRSAEMTDEALIEDVRDSKHGGCQASAITDRDGRMPDHIGIFAVRNGYSVRAVFATPEGLKVRVSSGAGLGGDVRKAVEATGGI